MRTKTTTGRRMLQNADVAVIVLLVLWAQLALSENAAADEECAPATTIVLAAVDGFDFWGTSISANGQVVVITTDAALVPADTNGAPDVYVVDRVTGWVELISVSTGGEVGNDRSGDRNQPFVQKGRVSISYDGQIVAFNSAVLAILFPVTRMNSRISLFATEPQERQSA